MSFLGMGPLEILLILLIAFIFLGPERMIDAARLLAKTVREARNFAEGIPRVVVEDDDVKIVDRGRKTSVMGESPAERPRASTKPDAPAGPDDDGPESGGPVPFSRGPTPAAGSDENAPRRDEPAT